MIIIGIDVGTTGTKALAVDDTGKILGYGYCEYSLETPRDGWVIQNAEDWWKASVCAVREALSSVQDKNSVAAIGLSTQGATMLAADENGNPLSHAITWMDTRADKETAELIEKFGEELIYRKSGWNPAPTLDASKIMWIRKNNPDLFKSASYFISTLEFMNIKLTGRNIIDPSNAAIRQIMDIQVGEWDSEILDFLGIDESRLPEIMPSGEFIGMLTQKASDDLGLPQNIKVYNGAHDQYCSAIGSGTLNPGEILIATGTTWVALGVTEKLLYSKSRLAPGIFPLTGYFGAMASMVSAGSALKWWRSVIGGSYADIDSGASERMETAADLLVYPYVAGAGILHDPNEKAAVIGMTLRHDKYDIARALMEGVAFEARLLLEEFARCGMKTKTLTMSGGAAKSSVWREITGYVTGYGINLTEESESACIGAAMTAAVGLGIYADLQFCAKIFVKQKKAELSDIRQYEFYEDKFKRYCDRFKQVTAMC